MKFNKSLPTTPGSGSSSAARFTSLDPAWLSSTRYPPMRLFSLIIAMLAVGCASHIHSPGSKVEHSRLWVSEPQRNLWSFERVATLRTVDGRTNQVNAYVTRQLQAGEAVVFENGGVVTHDGATLRVANEPLKSLNAVVNHDGTLRRGAFIRTFQ
jgi:hypothetical protein